MSVWFWMWNDHYFLQCPLYSNLRINLSEQLIGLNFEVNMASLLFGDDNLSQANNIAATYKIHDCIKDTNRFEWMNEKCIHAFISKNRPKSAKVLNLNCDITETIDFLIIFFNYMYFMRAHWQQFKFAVRP